MSLSIDQIEVPEGMIQAYEAMGLQLGFNIAGNGDPRRKAFAAALLWLAEHPIVPSETETDAMAINFNYNDSLFGTFARWFAVEWQRRMFLKPEPELPEEVKALTWKANPFPNIGAEARHDAAVLKAYELGKKAGAK